jgi:hypothetical protein
MDPRLAAELAAHEVSEERAASVVLGGVLAGT